MHIFIDTNVFLAFYAYTKDDVEQLRIIVELAKSNKIKIYMPDQVVKEFYRNREVKLAESIKDFRKNISQPGLPRYILSYEQASELKKKYKELEDIRAALAVKVTEDVEKMELAADKLFVDINKVAERIKTTPDIIDKARHRKFIGDPPGKGESYGDQINWESLLDGVPNEVDLHVISKDGDFASAFSPARASYYLISEWKNKKKGKLLLHEELRPFLNSSFEDIKLATDVEKISALEELETAGYFGATHIAIAKLTGLIGALTWTDADRILRAGIENNQISWIGTDDDVNKFYRDIMQKYEDKLDADRKLELEKTFPNPAGF